MNGQLARRIESELDLVAWSQPRHLPRFEFDKKINITFWSEVVAQYRAKQ